MWGISLLTVVVVLLVAWLVGFGLYELMGTAIRLLIAVALVALIFRIMGARPFRGTGALPPPPGPESEPAGQGPA
jgi:hypothetical protein